MTLTLLRSPELRELETRYADQPLMERAGRAAAEVALRILDGRSSPVLVLAGPGNNGGDARVMARHLSAAGVGVVLAEGTEVPAGDYALVVDGLFGIGLARPIAGDHARLVERINAYRDAGGPVLALDVPSGLDADTGRTLGIAVRASHTATFIAGKPGLYTLDGPDHAGEISVHDLGLAPTGPGRLLSRDDFAGCLAPRRRNSHKGSYGDAGIVGGAPGMTGAALLAGRAALKLGAGRVFVGLMENLPVDPMQPELMLRGAGAVQSLSTALAIGPGLGQAATAVDLVRRAAGADIPLLLDADALNLLAAYPVLARHVARRSQPTLLTPHPAEAGRLLGTDTASIQGDRVAAAQELARRFNAVVALKGCGTVIADARKGSGEHWWVNPTGNPGLATAGSGDVLAGMVIALLAQGWPPREALLGGVHLHGAAADALVAQDDRPGSSPTGPIGLAAGELIPAARSLLNRWAAALA